MSTPGIAPKHILVVDDEPIVCDAVKMMLEFDGHHIETAHGAEQALALFEKSDFDVVITDYSMPGMKGNELAARCKTLKPGQPVVMITAYAEMLAAEQIPLDAVDHLISKPFLLEDLRAAIAKVTAAR
ncbi:MAG: response regulator [Verrucomicrobiae bacterium]|nr:response regulator [Verrucomicrobiae bacterium]MDW8308864.1 response regulator [Verrucomicrobiales bacterium]